VRRLTLLYVQLRNHGTCVAVILLNPLLRAAAVEGNAPVMSDSERHAVLDAERCPAPPHRIHKLHSICSLRSP
jgi:hypothetical protein